MYLANPLMMMGITAISVPIIIHLLNQRKFERVVWAAMRFINNAVIRNQRRIQVEDLLLLLLRCLLLALLVMALARPVSKAFAISGLGKQKVIAAIVLDNSGSMSTTDGQQTRYEKGKAAALQIIDSLPEGSAVSVTLASDVSDLSGDETHKLIENPTYNLKAAKDRITNDAPLSARGTDLFPAVTQAFETLEAAAFRKEPDREVYVITDGMENGWSRLDAMVKTFKDGGVDADSTGQSKIQTTILLIQSDEKVNMAITDLEQDGDVTRMDQPVRINVTVKNFGEADAADVNVNTYVDLPAGKDAGGSATATEAVGRCEFGTVGHGESKTISEFIKFDSEGYHSLTAKLDTKLPDHVQFDDTRTIMVKAVKQVKVLLVDGSGESDKPAESPVRFVREAIESIDPAFKDQYYMRTETTTPAEFESVLKEDEPTEYCAIFMVDVQDMSDSAVRKLNAFVRHGGGLFVFLGDKVSADFYDKVSDKGADVSSSANLGDLLPALLGKAIGDAEKDDVFFNLAQGPYTDPLVTLWNQEGVGSLTTSKFFKAYELKTAAAPTVSADEQTQMDKLTKQKADLDDQIEKLGAAVKANPKDSSSQKTLEADEKSEDDLNKEMDMVSGGGIGTATVVLKFAQAAGSAAAGLPALVSRRWGRGMIYEFASSADCSWTDMPRRPAFLPLVIHAIAQMWHNQGEVLTIRAGEPYTLRLSADKLHETGVFTLPGQGKDDPHPSISPVLENDSAVAVFKETDQAGVYTCSIANEDHKFAVVPNDPEESSLETLSPKELGDLGAVAHVQEWKVGETVTEAIDKERKGQEWWPTLLWMALAIAVAETFLAQWFSRSK